MGGVAIMIFSILIFIDKAKDSRHNKDNDRVLRRSVKPTFESSH